MKGSSELKAQNPCHVLLTVHGGLESLWRWS